MKLYVWSDGRMVVQSDGNTMTRQAMQHLNELLPSIREAWLSGKPIVVERDTEVIPVHSDIDELAERVAALEEHVGMTHTGAMVTAR